MEKKLRSVLSGAGFYAALAICLAVVAAGGWALLRGGGERPAESGTPDAAANAPVSMYVPDAPEAVRGQDI